VMFGGTFGPRQHCTASSYTPVHQMHAAALRVSRHAAAPQEPRVHATHNLRGSSPQPHSTTGARSQMAHMHGTVHIGPATQANVSQLWCTADPHDTEGRFAHRSSATPLFAPSRGLSRDGALWGRLLRHRAQRARELKRREASQQPSQASTSPPPAAVHNPRRGHRAARRGGHQMLARGRENEDIHRTQLIASLMALRAAGTTCCCCSLQERAWRVAPSTAPLAGAAAATDASTRHSYHQHIINN